MAKFSLGHDDTFCDEEEMRTSLITIQNEKVITSQCTVSTWTRNNPNDEDRSESCLTKCGRKDGKCSVCDIDGNEGFCCRGSSKYSNGNCPDQAIIVSPYARHACVHGKSQFDTI